MASITERGPYQIHAVVRRKGYPMQIKTFETRREASDWASVIESEMVRGVFIPRTALEKMTFGQALIKYRNEITIKKRGARMTSFYWRLPHKIYDEWRCG